MNFSKNRMSAILALLGFCLLFPVEAVYGQKNETLENWSPVKNTAAPPEDMPDFHLIFDTESSKDIPSYPFKPHFGSFGTHESDLSGIAVLVPMIRQKDSRGYYWTAYYRASDGSLQVFEVQNPKTGRRVPLKFRSQVEYLELTARIVAPTRSQKQWVVHFIVEGARNLNQQTDPLSGSMTLQFELLPEVEVDTSRQVKTFATEKIQHLLVPLPRSQFMRFPDLDTREAQEMEEAPDQRRPAMFQEVGTAGEGEAFPAGRMLKLLELDDTEPQPLRPSRWSLDKMKKFNTYSQQKAFGRQLRAKHTPSGDYGEISTIYPLLWAYAADEIKGRAGLPDKSLSLGEVAQGMGSLIKHYASDQLKEYLAQSEYEVRQGFLYYLFLLFEGYLEMPQGKYLLGGTKCDFEIALKLLPESIIFEDFFADKFDLDDLEVEASDETDAAEAVDERRPVDEGRPIDEILPVDEGQLLRQLVENFAEAEASELQVETLSDMLDKVDEAGVKSFNLAELNDAVIEIGVIEFPSEDGAARGAILDPAGNFLPMSATLFANPGQALTEAVSLMQTKRKTFYVTLKNERGHSRDYQYEEGVFRWIKNGKLTFLSHLGFWLGSAWEPEVEKLSYWQLSPEEREDQLQANIEQLEGEIGKNLEQQDSVDFVILSKRLSQRLEGLSHVRQLQLTSLLEAGLYARALEENWGDNLSAQAEALLDVRSEVEVDRMNQAGVSRLALLLEKSPELFAKGIMGPMGISSRVAKKRGQTFMAHIERISRR